jgi:homoserine O-succinyltransferase/O-acetyltransferase
LHARRDIGIAFCFRRIHTMSRVEQFLLGRGHSPAAVHVGLLNNMPDAALRATELQFARLLKDASGNLDIRLRLFSLASLERSAETRTRMAGFYDDAAFIQAANIDALIVTSTAPAAEGLGAAACWKELANVIDWAQTGTLSTLFSGYASVAAVQHLDGIVHHALPAKLLGVYASTRAEDDPLFFNSAPSVPVPHARRHTIGESELRGAGYRVLARLENGQVDMFARETPGQSRFVFLQGHPEYDPGTLGRFYLNDMDYFLAGKASERPSVPAHYFDRATEGRLAEIADTSGLMPYQQVVLNALPRQVWHPHTVRLIGNWLMLVAAAKARRMASKAVPVRRRAS